MARRPATRPAAADDRLQADAEALHLALSALVRIYQYRDRDRICCHDISVTQCHALETLVERGPQRSQELSDALRLDKSTTTRVVDALVRKAYVERTPDPADRRAVTLRATAAGRRLYQRINAELVQQQAGLLADLDPALRAGTLEVIRRLAASAEQRFAGDGRGATCLPSADGAAPVAGCAPAGC